MNNFNFISLSIIILLIPIIMAYCIIGTHIAFGQNATPPKPTTSVPNITPTSPNPNVQYLPQKGYVQLFAPENGIPPAPALSPLPQGSIAPAVQPIPTAVPVQNQAVAGIPVNDIIQYAIAGGTALLGKMGWDKAKEAKKNTDKNEVLVKETMSAEVKTKDQVGELARLLFEWNEQKSNELNGTAPKVKLDTLREDKEEFTEKTAKA